MTRLMFSSARTGPKYFEMPRSSMSGGEDLFSTIVWVPSGGDFVHAHRAMLAERFVCRQANHNRSTRIMTCHGRDAVLANGLNEFAQFLNVRFRIALKKKIVRQRRMNSLNVDECNFVGSFVGHDNGSRRPKHLYPLVLAVTRPARIVNRSKHTVLKAQQRHRHIHIPQRAN